MLIVAVKIMFRQNAVSTLASGKTLFPSCYVWHEKESPENRKQLFHSTVTTKPSSNLCSTQSTQAQEKPWLLLLPGGALQKCEALACPP